MIYILLGGLFLIILGLFIFLPDEPPPIEEEDEF